LKLTAVVVIVLAAVSPASASTDDPLANPQWPNLAFDEPKWPNVPADQLPDPQPNPSPSFVNTQQVMDRILGASSGGGSDITGSTARWPELPQERRPSPFSFELGARYWYSSGTTRFLFNNGSAAFGNPTSTLYWNDMVAHTGEAFARLDHVPTGVFVKGLAGLGVVTTGYIDDQDFFANQIKFSDTRSDVNDGNLSYAVIDIGWAYTPVPDIRIGFFAGYHFWRESVTAYGLRCNDASFIVTTCAFAGHVPIGFDVAVLRYEPTWHAVRIGVEGRAVIAERWSVTGEFAVVPYAVLQNKDSHLLRTDLGATPNVITDSSYAYGFATDLFVNYALTPNIEVGAGVRYWALTAQDGDVLFGPLFNSPTSLNTFEQQRFGLLVQAKGKF
jgi:outer membrane protease